MKKIKTIVIAASFMVAGFALGACTDSVMAEQKRPLKIWFENNNGNHNTYCVVDDNTGVNYVVVGKDNMHGGIAITPRLNADGSLYVSK